MMPMKSFIYRLFLARLTGSKLRYYSQVTFTHIRTDCFKPLPVSVST
jgi:hypothetical protein